MTGDYLILLTTMPDSEAAAHLARTLVDERLAACVNLLPPMQSVYRWQGGVQEDAEHQLIVKTTRPRLDALRERIHALHPYQVPEILVISVADASQAYGAWLTASTE
jgi:periplasmic divalent cation tolerance protein